MSYYESDEPTINQANGLPNGWVWRDFDDGSGGLYSPDKKSYVSYDFQTKEYRFKDEQWQLFDGYPYEPEGLASVKARAENHVRDLLTKENNSPESPLEQKKSVMRGEAR